MPLITPICLSPKFVAAEGIETAGAAERDHQEKAAHQAADDGCCDHFAGEGIGALGLIRTINAISLPVTHPVLIDAAPIPTLEVAWLAAVAVTLVSSISTEGLVIAAIGRPVAGGPGNPSPPAGILTTWAATATILIGAIGAIPDSIAALSCAVAGGPFPVSAATWEIPRHTESSHMVGGVETQANCSWHCLVQDPGTAGGRVHRHNFAVAGVVQVAQQARALRAAVWRPLVDTQRVSDV